MPVALDTSEIFPYVLSTDRTKPEGKRPTLLFHFPSCRETRQIANLFDQGDKAKTIDDSIKFRCEAMRIILVGWEHFTDRKGKAIKYDPMELDVVLTEMDFTELNARLLRDMSFAETEKKRFALSAPSSSENSATNVTAGSA